jgi:hypothetical protein
MSGYADFVVEFIGFDWFITKDVMTLVYVLGAVCLTLISIVMIFWGGSLSSFKTAGEAIAAGLAVLLIGNLVWRLFCEFIVVLFRINDSLISIDKKI